MAQPSRNGFIGSRQPLLAIDNHHRHRGFCHRQAGLLADLRQKFAVVIEDQATGVNHTEGAAAPKTFLVGAIAGYSRLVMDNRVTTTAQAVHQGGLAHVGPPDDGHHRQGHGCVPLALTVFRPYRPALSRLSQAGVFFAVEIIFKGPYFPPVSLNQDEEITPVQRKEPFSLAR